MSTSHQSDKDAAAAAAYHQPSPVETPVEALIARSTIKRALYVAPVIVAAAWVLAGGLGAVSAAIGVAIVVANFWLSGLILSRAAARSMSVYHAAALFGFFVRLGLITATMFLVAAVFEVDRKAFGLAAVIAYLTLLTWEAWALSKSPERELEWTN